MFKKIYEIIEEKTNEIEQWIKESESFIISKISFKEKFVQDLYDQVRWVSEHDRAKEKYIATLQSQQRTIEQLTDALKDKYEHGLFIFSEDGEIPTVIRNGKELTSCLTTSFSIDWTPGEGPNIRFEQLAATSSESDV